MNWSQEQIRRYNELLGRIRAADSWLERAKICFPDATAPGPASGRAIQRAEKALGRKFPAPLQQVYRECGGIRAHYGTPFVMPLDDLVAKNEWFRSDDALAEFHMPFEHLLLFGEEGNGDMYAFPIAIDGGYGMRSIFEWNHEDDSRSWRASSIADLFARLATEWSD